MYQILCLVAWLDCEPTNTTAKHHLARIRYNMWDEMCSSGRNKCYLCKKSPNPHVFFLWSSINLFEPPLTASVHQSLPLESKWGHPSAARGLLDDAN